MSMFLRCVNGLLLTAAVIGGVLVYFSQTEHRRLLAEHTRLASRVGDLPIDDPSKVYVRALETGEELHFAWRVYFPASYRVQWQLLDGDHTAWSNSRQEFIARVRIREHSDGRLAVFCRTGLSTSMLTLGNRELAEVLRGRWNEIVVHQLADGACREVEPDEVTTLLRLTLPDELKEALRASGGRNSKRFENELFFIQFGSQQAFQNREQRDSSIE